MSNFLNDELAEARHAHIPDGLSPDNVVGIVTIHDPLALQANRDTAYRKSRLKTPRAGGEWSLDGCHIFLHLIQGRHCYTMGRSDSRSAPYSTRDVYLPGSTVGVHQFGITPVWENNSWRLQSASETIAEVNGAPIQLSTPRTRKLPAQLPQAIYLRQNLVNYAFVNGLRVDVFMLKTVREVYPIQAFWPAELRPQLQEVSHRPEAWAQTLYLQCPEKVSANTCRVLERFTGKIETAKFFRHAQNGRVFRDAEFLKFGKTKVDASLVRYLQSVEVNHIPAVITETHEGFETYAALEDDIKKQHPRVRFTIASKLLRRLFSALAFMHFHKIVHGNVTKESVLLRLVDFKPEAVLLVDYTNATSFPAGTPEPHKKMTEDGRAAMKIVESCCDIWQLRKAATKDACNEDFMAKKTETAREEFAVVERVVADFFGPKGMLRESEKGKKMLRLLVNKQGSWDSARNSQIHNSTRREVGSCRSDMIKEVERDWVSMHPSPKMGEEQHMVLTLGHPYLDGLASKLYHNRWDLPPRDVCTRIQQLAGSIEDPWQTFEAKRTVSFTLGTVGFDERCISYWLASCCEAYPEWRHAVVEECERHIAPQHGIVTFADIKKLQNALVGLGIMPEAMQASFAQLTGEEIKRQPTTHIEETHQVWYHQPSRMFNLTQLHRLATPDRFFACINEGDIACDDWVEVRGEPMIEGLYATLSLLVAFGAQLGLEVEVPNHTQDYPPYDPADFSRVLHHVILAHTGLLPWATVTRERAQFNFHGPLNTTAYESAGTFLPTYFGSMKMLPTMPYGSEVYRRPDHWSKFKTGKELDEATDLYKRPMLQAKGLLKKSHRASSPHLDQSILSQTLESRRRARAKARFPAKRNADDQASVATMQTSKRSHTLAIVDKSNADNAPPAEGPQLTTSFMDRELDRLVANMERQAQPPSGEPLPAIPRTPNESFFRRGNGVNTNIDVSPPEKPAATNKTFTIASGSDINLEDDYKQAEKWLETVKVDGDAPQVASIFGLNFHHSFRQQGDGSDTEPDESDSDDDDGETPKAGEKAKQVNLPAPNVKESSPFTHGFRATTLAGRSNQQAVSQSFPGWSSFQLATLKKNSPAFIRSAFAENSLAGSGSHRRNDMSISDLARVDLRNAPTHASPLLPIMEMAGSALPSPSSPPQLVGPSDVPDLSTPACMISAQSGDGDGDDDEDLPDTIPWERFSQYSD